MTARLRPASGSLPGCIGGAAHIASVVLGTAILAACAVDEVAEVERYRTLLDAGERSAPVDDAQPLDVLDAMRLANQRNETLDIEGERYLQAVIDQRRAAANFLPTLTLAPSYVFRENVSDLPAGAFDLPVFLGMEVSPVSDLATVRAAAAQVEVRRGDLYSVQDALLLDVARIHAQVLAAEKAVEVLSNSLAVQEARVADAQARFESGLIRPLDVRTVESQAAQTGVLLTVARTRVATGRSLLGFLVAEPMSTRPLIDRLVVPDVTLDLDALTEIALERRPERLAAGAAIEFAREVVEAAYGQYYPTISLELVAFLSRQSLPDNLDWTGLVSVSIPLFSAGLIEADVRTALSLLRQARFADSRLARSIRRDVETAVENLEGANRRIRQLEVQVAVATDALAQADGLFTVGLATNLERIDAQDRQLSSELELVQARLDRSVFWLDLLRVTGQLDGTIGLTRPEPMWPSRSDWQAPKPEVAFGAARAQEGGHAATR